MLKRYIYSDFVVAVTVVDEIVLFLDQEKCIVKTGNCSTKHLASSAATHQMYDRVAAALHETARNREIIEHCVLKGAVLAPSLCRAVTSVALLTGEVDSLHDSFRRPLCLLWLFSVLATLHTFPIPVGRAFWTLQRQDLARDKPLNTRPPRAQAWRSILKCAERAFLGT